MIIKSSIKWCEKDLTTPLPFYLCLQRDLLLPHWTEEKGGSGGGTEGKASGTGGLFNSG